MYTFTSCLLVVQHLLCSSSPHPKELAFYHECCYVCTVCELTSWKSCTKSWPWRRGPLYWKILHWSLQKVFLGTAEAKWPGGSTQCQQANETYQYHNMDTWKEYLVWVGIIRGLCRNPEFVHQQPQLKNQRSQQLSGETAFENEGKAFGSKLLCSWHTPENEASVTL